ncbi:MAG TPA: hypothetical protein VKE25_05590, partial [Actinomycetes bacterium]|nr:hypothetical protein [Actinomycetes bacterium]
MLEALLLGALAQLSLLLSGLLASGVTVPRRIIGWLAGFGAGALVSAITFDLTEQAEALGNIPQALAPSAELSASGWSRQRLSALWATVV